MLNKKGQKDAAKKAKAVESYGRWEHEGIGTQQQHGLVAKRELQKVMANVDINE